MVVLNLRQGKAFVTGTGIVFTMRNHFFSLAPLDKLRSMLCEEATHLFIVCALIAIKAYLLSFLPSPIFLEEVIIYPSVPLQLLAGRV